MNLLAGLLALFSIATSMTEHVPCITDQMTCSTAESLSVVNNNHFCCESGFSMQWRSNGSRGAPAVCVCERFYFISDCLEGQGQCLGATSMTSDGQTVKCCKHGDRLNSVSNSTVSGEVISHCKCYRYLSKSGDGQKADARALTAFEEMQFLGALGLLPEELQATVNQMSGVMNPNPGPNLNQWAMTFADGLVQGLIKALNEANNTRSQFTRRQNLRRYDRNNVASNNYIQPNYLAMKPNPPQVFKSAPTNTYFQDHHTLSGQRRASAINPYNSIRQPAKLSHF